MLQTCNLFETLGKNSSVWLYTADRRLTDAEVIFIEEQLKIFNNSWSAHGKKLNSNAALLNNYVIILAVDGSFEPASGCSIDSSVHFIKKLGSELNIDFFNRMNVLAVENESISLVPYAHIRKYKGLKYFNPLISTLGELRENWLIES